MTPEEIKNGAPDTIIYYRRIFFWKQYFVQDSDSGFWYHYASPFWFFYDSEKPLFIKPLP